MITYMEVHNTIWTNPSGVMQTKHYYDIPKVLSDNKKMYFYRGRYENLIEIMFAEDLLNIFYFDHTPEDKRHIIKDEMEFYTSYFDSAGLKGKRFLFDVEFKLPVVYNDFVEMEIPLLSSRYIPIIIGKNDGTYVTGTDTVKVFASMKDNDLDSAMLALANKLCIMDKPTGLSTENGILTMTVIAGLLSYIDIESLEFDINGTSVRYRIYDHMSVIPINPELFNSNKSSIKKFGNLKRIINELGVGNKSKIVGNEIKDDNNPLLSEIAGIGLDHFMKTIKDTRKTIVVNIDVSQDKIRNMYIVNGVAFIHPVSESRKHYDDFVEMLSSENIQLVFS